MAVKKGAGAERLQLNVLNVNEEITLHLKTKNVQGKIELNKFCKWERKHTLHKETKIK